MNKLEKFLRKLNKKEREAVLLVLFQIEKDAKKVPGIIKLAGHKDLYRVRIGQYRVIFRITLKRAEIIRVTKRNENTYENL